MIKRILSTVVSWRRLTLLRLVVFTVLLLVALVAWQEFVSPVARRAPDAWRLLAEAASALGYCVAMLAFYRALVRLLEQRSTRELAWRPGGARWLGTGAATGAALFCVVYAVLWLAGIAHWQGYLGLSGVPTAALVALMAAVGEELVFRAAIFRIVEEAFGTTVALVVSAGFFGVAHAFQPGANLTSVLAIALEAGVLLGAAYAASRSLWLPIGLHFAWNFTEGGVFGAAVSGFQANGVFKIELSGADLWTGGQFGPEASVIAVACCTIAATGFIVLAVREDRWRKLRFSMRSTPG